MVLFHRFYRGFRKIHIFKANFLNLNIHKPYLGSSEAPQKFDSDRFRRFDVYWLQKKTDTQTSKVYIDRKIDILKKKAQAYFTIPPTPCPTTFIVTCMCEDLVISMCSAYISIQNGLLKW